jgi:hypothetical protein
MAPPHALVITVGATENVLAFLAGLVLTTRGRISQWMDGPR